MDRKLLALLLSAIFLYLTGVLTGAYLGSKSALDITFPLFSKTAELERKINQLEERLSSTFDTLYVLQLAEEKDVTCRVLDQSLKPLLSEISDMIRLLPPRLETAQISEVLLERYTSINVRAFLAADYIYRHCSMDTLPVLYLFVEGDDEAGKVVDRLRESYDLLVFVAWSRSSDPFVRALDVNSPSLYVCGELVPVEEAEEVIKRCSTS